MSLKPLLKHYMYLFSVANQNWQNWPLKTNGRLDLKIGDTLNLEVGKRVDKTDGYELNQNNPYNNESNNEMIVDIINKEYKIVGIIERPANNIE